MEYKLSVCSNGTNLLVSTTEYSLLIGSMQMQVPVYPVCIKVSALMSPQLWSYP